MHRTRAEAELSLRLLLAFFGGERASDLEPTALTSVFPRGEAWTPLDLGEIGVPEVGPKPSCLELLRQCQV